jgi:type IV pilus assembly protein PilF
MALNACHFHAPDPLRADAEVNLGMIYLKQGNWVKARLALMEAIAVEPRSPVSWGAMGYLEESCGNISLAASYYRHAIQLNPRRGEAHNNYGTFLCRHGQPRQGIDELLRAIHLPSYIYRAAAYQNAGRCALKIPDPVAAETFFRAAKTQTGRRNDHDQW